MKLIYFTIAITWWVYSNKKHFGAPSKPFSAKIWSIREAGIYISYKSIAWAVKQITQSIVPDYRLPILLPNSIGLWRSCISYKNKADGFGRSRCSHIIWRLTRCPKRHYENVPNHRTRDIKRKTELKQGTNPNTPPGWRKVNIRVDSGAKKILPLSTEEKYGELDIGNVISPFMVKNRPCICHVLIPFHSGELSFSMLFMVCQAAAHIRWPRRFLCFCDKYAPDPPNHRVSPIRI